MYPVGPLPRSSDATRCIGIDWNKDWDGSVWWGPRAAPGKFEAKKFCSKKRISTRCDVTYCCIFPRVRPSEGVCRGWHSCVAHARPWGVGPKRVAASGGMERQAGEASTSRLHARMRQGRCGSCLVCTTVWEESLGGEPSSLTKTQRRLCASLGCKMA